MLKQKEVNVGGEQYLISTLPATKGLKVLKSLTKLLGPAFAELTKGGDGEEVNLVSLAVEKLIDNLDNCDVESLVVSLMTCVTKQNMAINFDMEFAGSYDKLFLLAKEVVDLNYGSVFTLVGIGGE